MVRKDELELWKKMLATKMHSFTDHSKEYAIFHDGEEYVCDCMDFKIRKGSHHIQYTDPMNNETGDIKTCKHVAQFLADNGAEVFELFAWGSKRKIERRRSS